MQAKQQHYNKLNRIHAMYASMKSTRIESAILQRRRHACVCHVFPVSHSTFKSQLLFGFLLILFYCVNDTGAFNLEDRLPIVKYGEVDTYFGYSVAGHEISDEMDGHSEKW